MKYFNYCNWLPWLCPSNFSHFENLSECCHWTHCYVLQKSVLLQTIRNFTANFATFWSGLSNNLIRIVWLHLAHNMQICNLANTAQQFTWNSLPRWNFECIAVSAAFHALFWATVCSTCTTSLKHVSCTNCCSADQRYRKIFDLWIIVKWKFPTEGADLRLKAYLPTIY